MGVIEYLKGLYSVYDRVFSMRSLQAPTVIIPCVLNAKFVYPHGLSRFIASLCF